MDIVGKLLKRLFQIDLPQYKFTVWMMSQHELLATHKELDFLSQWKALK